MWTLNIGITEQNDEISIQRLVNNSMKAEEIDFLCQYCDGDKSSRVYLLLGPGT